MLGMEVDLQRVENNVFAVETVLKAWLQEQGGDREHLHLLLPAPPDHDAPGYCTKTTKKQLKSIDVKHTSFTFVACAVCVKCDMQERLISPALIPYDSALGAKTETMKDFMPVNKGSANQSQPPQTLKAIK